ARPGGRPGPAVPAGRRRGRRGGPGPVTGDDRADPRGSVHCGQVNCGQPVVAGGHPGVGRLGYAGLRVAELAAGESVAFTLPAAEAVLLPLAGSCTVRCGGDPAGLAGRPSVFAGPTDLAYLPAGSAVEVSAVDGCRFAVPTARTDRRLPFRYLPAG